MSSITDILIGIVIIGHGLIVAGQSFGSLNTTNGQIGISNPSFLNWWPSRFGQSWLLSMLNLERSPFNILISILWILSGLSLVIAGIGILVNANWWTNIIILGAILSLILLIIYLHPFFIVGIIIDLIILYLTIFKN